MSLLGLFGALACGGEGSRQQPPEATPAAPGANIVVVSFDALRADALGIYGAPARASPRIDAFAAQATVFERAYTTAPVTPTSFASAFTGRLPHRSFRAWKLQPAPTLAEIFAAAGYRTAAFVNNAQLTDERGFDRGFERYRFFRSTADERVIEEALGWLSAPQPEPFLLWLHLLTPHAPYDVQAEAADLYEPDYQGRFLRTSGIEFEVADEAEAARIRSLYAGEVRLADRLFGRLVDHLSDAGLLDRSVVVLTSDHGEELGEHGGYQHTTLFEETLRVPLLLRLPGGSAPGRSDQLYSHVDLLPTLAALTGAPSPADLDGRDVLADPEREPMAVAMAYTSADYRAISLRRGDLKLILNCRPATSVEIYDLAADPGETRDLGRARGRDLAALHAELTELLGPRPCQGLDRALAGRQPAEGLAPETVEELRALGYID